MIEIAIVYCESVYPNNLKMIIKVVGIQHIYDGLRCKPEL
ncbi:MAG: hypothetical protein KatS3mg087_0830 [Patescibacteria group bacterium]|nr:MAG: hypothetical protein KatS3mg087_0830 [Patescibacteria group bacterium]